jgi:2-isopropylmalate synthase
LWELFDAEYLSRTSPIELLAWSVADGSTGPRHVRATLCVDGEVEEIHAAANGPLEAFTLALSQAGLDADVLSYSEHAVSSGRDSAAAYIELRHRGVTRWGVAIDNSVLSASIRAVMSALNRTISTQGDR